MRGSCRQFLIGDPVASRCLREAIKPCQRVPPHVAVVKAEGELINVPAQVLLARMVIYAVQTSLQDGPNTFNAIGRHAAPHVLARLMIDRLVPE